MMPLNQQSTTEVDKNVPTGPPHNALSPSSSEQLKAKLHVMEQRLKVEVDHVKRLSGEREEQLRTQLRALERELTEAKLAAESSTSNKSDLRDENETLANRNRELEERCIEAEPLIGSLKDDLRMAKTELFAKEEQEKSLVVELKVAREEALQAWNGEESIGRVVTEGDNQELQQWKALGQKVGFTTVAYATAVEAAKDIQLRLQEIIELKKVNSDIAAEQAAAIEAGRVRADALVQRAIAQAEAKAAKRLEETVLEWRNKLDRVVQERGHPVPQVNI